MIEIELVSRWITNTILLLVGFGFGYWWRPIIKRLLGTETGTASPPISETPNKPTP